MTDPRHGGIAVLDFGSQYTQLIARRVREQGVYAEVFPYDADPAHVTRHGPRGVILSGGPSSVYEPGAPQLPRWLLAGVPLPILGICYGMQALTYALGGVVAPAAAREYGLARIARRADSPLLAGLPETLDVWMSHGDRIETPPPGFAGLAASDNADYAAIGDPARRLYGVQFHPEVAHTPRGADILHNYLFGVCGCAAGWSPSSFIEDAVAAVRQRVGGEKVILGLSGGVDSAVAAALLQRAVGDQLTAIFVNTGLLRKDEPQDVVRVFRDQQGVNLIAVDATEDFLDGLRGVTEPEAKRKLIGRLFIDTFAAAARQLEGVRFLAQGTIYPDVIESAASSQQSKTIKSHHNVGGLPADLQFELVEPLRDLFKDEVRKVGTALGLPDSVVWRQPFPGPGLAVRCLGELTWERLETLRVADAIFTEELAAAGLLRQGTAQAFAVLLPVKSVGVMGDNRTYEEVIALRAVTTDDFMTADWARLPYDLLARASSRIVNEVKGVNRVVYDITSKPPGTIEWE